LCPSPHEAKDIKLLAARPVGRTLPGEVSATVDHVVIDTGRIARFACACNADRRFIEKHWVESPETLRELMATDAFKDSLRGLRKGVSLSDGDHVAALFHARQTVSRKHKAKPGP
jgi:hypothetical protein